MPHNQDPLVSTGRGGAGNIGRDPTVYTDGEIVREGFEGEAHEPEYSTGRGGAGNIGSPRIMPAAGERRRSQDVVPEQALRGAGAGYDNYHTGRGGEGNIHKDKYAGHSGPPHDKSKESLGDKVKKIFHADGKKSGDGTPGSTA
ncbi:uncharacterized protein K452DRAFT_282704 [Aplosporella prunicola CBS 121167]|uniref:Uncharacterized protein n=1 Tax=Aplosporella prunicola CBS 121167 TaxID=1176127 RepID=A0A6A6BT27_9PEZI|nr:uncharacterized protein K452DRAFT_282704 [Aplosporella prunicola CBS 121167]KAF2146533.1 hypothetical protein K452DRAFT_282704 [Aplosporella prunicola CBS 121167]